MYLVTYELHKKDLQDQDNHGGLITHLEPDILECEVKWALESITMNKASGGDGIPVELFQMLKDDAVKVLHSICQQIWKFGNLPAVATGLEKVSFHSNPKERQCQKCSNCHTIVFNKKVVSSVQFRHSVMSNSLQPHESQHVRVWR